MIHASAGLAHLTGGGTSVVVDLAGPVPAVLHWGGRLADDPAELAGLRTALQRPVLNASPDVPVVLTLLPAPDDGWPGRPAPPRASSTSPRG